ncbi:MAG: YerC/YecD family TrpR-related protein [Proteobacteria bacterium]|nr:YerC/YecD family TrpR-related protein [Pseudomonadota bacterium]
MLDERNIDSSIDSIDAIDLFEAFLSVNSKQECIAFLRDLCTPAELRAMKERWLVAQLLNAKDLPYRKIHEETGVSIATITRVARFLFHEDYLGYKTILDKFKDRSQNSLENA